MKETIIASIILCLIVGGIGFISFLFQKIVNNALDHIKDQMSTMLVRVGEITSGLSNNMKELSETIKNERDERVENQKDIASIKTTLDSHGKSIEKLENKIDKHVEGHGKK